MLISIDGAGKNQLSHVSGYSSVVTLLFAEQSLTIGVLEYCCEGQNQLLVLLLLGCFLLITSLR